jgi:hypothetical protein
MMLESMKDILSTRPVKDFIYDASGAVVAGSSSVYFVYRFFDVGTRSKNDIYVTP